MPSVFTNGCFDIFHPGHLQLILYCRSIAGCDDVHVAIDSDSKVKRDKGKYRPYYSADERRSLLLSLTSDGILDHSGLGKYLVNWVEIFNTNDELYEIIKKFNPDYIVKGKDYKESKTIVGADLFKVKFAPSYYKESFSTTAIEQRILQKRGLI